VRATCSRTDDLWHYSGGTNVGGRATAHEMVAFSLYCMKLDIFRFQRGRGRERERERVRGSEGERGGCSNIMLCDGSVTPIAHSHNPASEDKLVNGCQ
jgi:hypothetical protein